LKSAPTWSGRAAQGRRGPEEPRRKQKSAGAHSDQDTKTRAIATSCAVSCGVHAATVRLTRTSRSAVPLNRAAVSRRDDGVRVAFLHKRGRQPSRSVLTIVQTSPRSKSHLNTEAHREALVNQRTANDKPHPSSRGGCSAARRPAVPSRRPALHEISSSSWPARNRRGPNRQILASIAATISRSFPLPDRPMSRSEVRTGLGRADRAQ